MPGIDTWKPVASARSAAWRITGEAVEHPAQLPAPLFRDDAQRVVFRFARVNDDRQPPLARQPQLRAKHRVLHVARREVVVVVEADLADRAHGAASRPAGSPSDPPPPPDRRRTGARGADARRSRIARPATRPARVAVRELRVVFGREDHETAHEPGAARARDDGLEIAGELLAGQMTVRIDHRTRVPGAAGSASSTIGRPPSGLAASTMPFDSMPISFAGFRFATMTTVLPTSAPVRRPRRCRRRSCAARCRRRSASSSASSTSARARPRGSWRTRSSTFMKSSIEMRSSRCAGAARCAGLVRRLRAFRRCGGGRRRAFRRWERFPTFGGCRSQATRIPFVEVASRPQRPLVQNAFLACAPGRVPIESQLGTGRVSPTRRRISAADAGITGSSSTAAMRTASADFRQDRGQPIAPALDLWPAPTAGCRR